MILVTFLHFHSVRVETAAIQGLKKIVLILRFIGHQVCLKRALPIDNISHLHLALCHQHYGLVAIAALEGLICLLNLLIEVNRHYELLTMICFVKHWQVHQVYVLLSLDKEAIEIFSNFIPFSNNLDNKSQTPKSWRLLAIRGIGLLEHVPLLCRKRFLLDCQ